MKEKKDNKNFYTIQKKDILEFIGSSSREALSFLYLYLEKIFKDSNNFIRYISDFLSKQDNNSFTILKQKFEQFLIANYKLGSRRSSNYGIIEANRIFPKVINIFSAYKNLLGTVLKADYQGIL
jgi:hypothetical protein